MKGLLLKEYYYTKGIMILFIVVFLFMFVINLSEVFLFDSSITNEENYFNLVLSIVTTSFVYTFCPSSLLGSSFAYDERSNFNKFILTSGVKRDTIVTSKLVYCAISYVFPLILFILTLILTYTVSPYKNIVSPYLAPTLIIQMIGGIFVYISMNLFFLISFGQVKQNIIMSFVNIFVAAILVLYMFSTMFLTGFQGLLISIIVTLILTLISIIFILFSYKKFKNKEF